MTQMLTNAQNEAVRRACLAVILCALFGLTPIHYAKAQSRPAVTVAPFVLKNTVLSEGDTKAYRPWFENQKWTGDLIEYHVFKNGERCTTVAVGEFPPNDLGNLALCEKTEIIGEDEVAVPNWSARSGFPSSMIDPDSGLFIEDPEAAEFWKNRNLFTYRRIGGTNTTPLWWDQLSGPQKQALDPITCQGLDVGGELCNSGKNAKEDSIILNYLRGDRSLELSKGGIFRSRFSLLGAIVNSRPVYVPVGDGLVVVGSNNGIVHGFSAVDGTETFGYIPSQLLPTLGAIADEEFDSNFSFFADGELRHANIGSNKHIVAGGLGSGGKGLFVLDVSTPANPTVLLELSGTHIDPLSDVEYLGNIHGRPSISRLPDDEWYVVTGNGYGSGAGAGLVLIDISDGARTYIDADASPENGLSAPALVDINNDGRADFAYAGDLEGNLWRFGLAPGNRVASLLFKAETDFDQAPEGRAQAITVEPDIARHPIQIGVMVYFGTGRLLNFSDASDTTPQSVYGIWDDDFIRTNTPNEDLFKLALTEANAEWDGRSRDVRIIVGENGQNGPRWFNSETDSRNLGWRINLPRAGERLLGRPQIRADRLQFITNNPSYDLEDTGYEFANWINQLSLESGGSLTPAEPLYDLDRSGNLDDGDAISVGGTDYYPIGLNLGPGIISQPAFGRVRQDIDAVFINGLIMLPPPTPSPNVIQAGGDMDVTTDSPYISNEFLVNPHDPSHPGNSEYGTDYPDFSSSPWAISTETVTARGPMNKHLAGDGAGNRVDGHIRAYNKVHGFNYVDFFDIEPRARAGQLRLDPGLLDAADNPFYAIRELNQPSESGLGPIDVLGEPPIPGEPLIPSDQEFIVVLTNADISKGTELKIGCRTWSTSDYMEMMYRQLISGTPPSDLRDEYHGNRGLIFTLADIDPDRNPECDDSTKPTLRITVTGQVGLEGVLHATLPGCVNNTHNLDGTEAQPDLITGKYPNPHITPNPVGAPQGTGYRWRNGALTMQLLRVTDGEQDYTLQTEYLPEGGTVYTAGAAGWGGIYAKGFEIDEDGTVIPWTPHNDNGLLYESSIFWNFGDMLELQQQGKDTVCFGHNQYYQPTLSQELAGLNKSQYKGFTMNLDGEENTLRDTYIEGLSLLQNEATVAQGLRLLATIWEEGVGRWAQGRTPDFDNLRLGYYHLMRGYAQRSTFKLNLLDIDRELFELPPPPTVTPDLTPALVEDVEVDLLPAAGPNYAPGRRSWIDVTPD